MAKYHLVPMRINLTRDEVSELSEETMRQMFQEMRLDEMNDQKAEKNNLDSLSSEQIFKETKIAFPDYVKVLERGKLDHRPPQFFDVWDEMLTKLL